MLITTLLRRLGIPQLPPVEDCIVWSRPAPAGLYSAILDSPAEDAFRFALGHDCWNGFTIRGDEIRIEPEAEAALEQFILEAHRMTRSPSLQLL